MSKSSSSRLTDFENGGEEAAASRGYPQALATLREQGRCCTGVASQHFDI